MKLFPPIHKSPFDQFFLKRNRVDYRRFSGWFFPTGAKFGSFKKWWSDEGLRDKRHEGIDFCFYKEGTQLKKIKRESRIPVLFDGKVVAIVPDFLGSSVVVQHPVVDRRERQFYSIYGHLFPEETLVLGSVKAGDVIGTLAEVKKRQDQPSGHLHLTMVFFPQKLDISKFNWDMLWMPGVTLVDPLHLIHCRIATL
jgi:murein DD-endopeptidase MepM/ murein hydrolase activator NlpD